MWYKVGRYRKMMNLVPLFNSGKKAQAYGKYHHHLLDCKLLDVANYVMCMSTFLQCTA